MSREPTPEQRAAIEAEGEILVSASAGSGKTFVMIEKMISLILSGKAEVSSVLAVTYTNLAAAEMKERLRAAVVARVNEEKDAGVRARLKAQIPEIGTADISTLHSFCSGVIRRYFYRIGVAADFRVAEPAEADKLRGRAVDLAFDELLEAKSERFARLGAVYAGSRGFKNLKKAVLEAYEKLIVKADFEGFLQQVPALYAEERFDAVCGEVLAALRARAEKLHAECLNLAEECEYYRPSGLTTEMHAAYIAGISLLAQEVCGAPDLFAAASALDATELMRKPSNRKIKESGDGDALALDERISALKTAVDAMKKTVADLRPRAEELAAFENAGQTAAAMCEALQCFYRRYGELKRRAGVLDFSDLEHKCLELLSLPDVGEEVRARYDYVFVDEYQDINPAQERILSLVSGKNVFMVGDMKQSIYGFRGCSAAFFANKYEELSKEGRALTLNGNFRSKCAVLGAVNDLFSGVMTEETGAVDYDKTARMQAGDPEGQAGGRVCVEFVPEQPEEEEEKPETPRGVYSVAEHLTPPEDEEYAEGALIAAIVADECQKTRTENGRQVPVGFGDIVVLTRYKTAKAARLLAELVKRGIPVASETEVDVRDYPEVKTMIGILQFLDNGSQDIPLACALRSEMGGLTDEELAKIRLFAGKDDTFYAACENYAHGAGDALAEKLRAFYALAEELRLLACVRSAAEIMTAVLSRTGMEAALLARPMGAERVRRLGRLIAESGTLSVPDFLERLKTGGKIGFSESGGENAVRLMTVHASKGLEFPVVIVAGMNNEFNSDDLRGVIYDDEWGFAFPSYDFKEYVSGETVLRTALKGRVRKKRAEDEMRLLYVAVTRAKERLHLVFSKNKKFEPEKVAEAGCFADFVDLAKFAESETPVFGAEVAPPAARVLAAGKPDDEAVRAVRGRYRVPYAHAEALGLPAKTSPSQLLQFRIGAETEGERADEEFYETPADAATGTAYHAFLERADFEAEPAAEAAKLYALLTAEGYTGLDEKKMENILAMPVFASLRGFALGRERAFLLSAPAREIGVADAEDELLVQGVVDLLAVRGEECVIVDYKYSSHGAERLAADYLPQLRIYAAAARRIPGVRRVSACIVNILRGFSVDVSV